MYVPDHFGSQSQQEMFELIEQYPFGLLIVADKAGTVDTAQVPFLFDRTASNPGRLLCHVARANPIWRGIEANVVTVVFSGPHAYISPDWYGTGNHVPTWNYVSVEISGSVTIMEDDALQSFVATLSAASESKLAPKAAWQVSRLESDTFAILRRAIVGLNINIATMEGKWKLSQNQRPEERDNVAQALMNLGGDSNTQIAALMNPTAREVQ